MIIAAFLIATAPQAQGTPARLTAVEDLRLGSVKDEQFRYTSVLAVRPLADGGFAAITGKASPFQWTLQVFDARGRERWSQPLPQNPTPVGLAVSGDTLLVHAGPYAPAAQLQQFMIGKGTPLNAVPMPPTERGQGVALVGSASGAAVVLTVTASVVNGNEVSAVERPLAELRLVSNAGVAQAPFFKWIDSTPRAVVQAGRGSNTTGVTLPWAPRSALTVAGGQVYYARGQTYAIDVYSTDGKPIRHISVPADATPIPQAMRDTWLAQWRAAGFGRTFTDSAFARIRALESPLTRPIIGGMWASAQGELAVQRRDRMPNPTVPGDSLYVDLLTAQGALRGSIVLAPGLVLQGYSGQHVYAYFRDTTQVAGRSSERSAFPLALAQIVRYRIDPSPR